MMKALLMKKYPLVKLTGLLLLCCMFSLTACEKVIDINLDKVEKKYVIEATVNDETGGAIVRISQTKDFDQDNTFPQISGATVSIRDNNTVYPLTEISPGLYQSATLTGQVGHTYELSVLVNGKTFTAKSTMPQKVNLDTIFVTDELIFTSTRKIVNAVFDDPVGLGNSYRFLQYVNGRFETQVLIRNDDYSDGRHIVNKLFYFSEDDEEKRNIKSGDLVEIKMLCIDEANYKYWYSLDRSATGIGGQATPSNPVSNLQGGALGYFSAQTIQSKTLKVP